MARARLTPALLLAGALATVPVPAHADYPTIDMTAIKQAIEQLNQLKKQYQTELDQLDEAKKSVSWLTELTGTANSLFSSIGKLARITLPITSITSLSSLLKTNASCLLPDGLTWGLNYKNLDLNVCSAASKYKSALFIKNDDIASLSLPEQTKQHALVHQRRTALLADTGTRALSLADSGLKQAETADTAADQLQSDLDAADDVQARLTVIAQAQILNVRTAAMQLQVQALALKLEGARALRDVPPNLITDTTSLATETSDTSK